jgi:hypothetical protein
MKNIYLISGLVALGLSFIVHKFFIQFIVFGVLFIILYVIEKNSCDVASLKKSIEEHNELIKKDIEELKRER